MASGSPPDGISSRLDAFIKGAGRAIAGSTPTESPFLNRARIRPTTRGRSLPTPSSSWARRDLKVFTALLLAESERLGKVSRLDPAVKFLLPPDDPAQKALAKITLLSLATHTSGLPRLPGNIGANPDGNPNPYATYDRAKLVEALRLHGPVAPVGRSMAYSNFGVAVLGEALGPPPGARPMPVTALGGSMCLIPARPEGGHRLALAGQPPPANPAPATPRQGRGSEWDFPGLRPGGRPAQLRPGKTALFLWPAPASKATALAALRRPRRRFAAASRQRKWV